MKEINTLCKKLGVEFKNIALLKTALTHSSYANENGGECNERLEFLGDAVLELCMSRYLISRYKLNEGDMTKKRAQSVREEALVIYASHLDLASYILLGNGEEQSGGRERPAIIADAFEAVLGACFMEFGFDRTYEVFSNIIVKYIDEVYLLRIINLPFKSLYRLTREVWDMRLYQERGHLIIQHLRPL